MSSCGAPGELVCPCPPVGLIDLVGKKWAICVVALLGSQGTVRFGPIQRCLTRVSPATLASTLRALERAALLRRPEVEGSRGPVRAYALTPAGRALYDRLLPLAEWCREQSVGRGTVISATPVRRRGGPGRIPKPGGGPRRAEA